MVKITDLIRELKEIELELQDTEAAIQTLEERLRINKIHKAALEEHTKNLETLIISLFKEEQK